MRRAGKVWKKAAAAILSAAMVVSMTPGELLRTEAEEVIFDKNDNDLRLWYTSPAEDSYSGWENWSLPIGNSSIGASVFGRVGRERIQLNEKSLWSGGPAEGRNYNGGNLEAKGQNGAVIKQIQELFKEGKNSEASTLCNNLQGLSDDAGTNGYGYYLSYGNMYLDFAGMTEGGASNYVRDLDMNTAVAGVSYDYNGIHYARENFISYPDNVLVTRLTADKSKSLNFKVSVVPDEGGNASGARTFTTTAADGMITLSGQLSDNQLKFHSSTKVVNEDGKVINNADGTIKVEDATTVTIYTSIGTDYKNDYPDYRTGETAVQLKEKVEKYVDAALKKGYETVKKDHIKDYADIFSRVDLDLGQEPAQVPTNELLSKYNAGTATAAERRELEVMLFQYGRYLTMGSSRAAREGEEVTLPANLQGIWVGKNNSSWHSDYHMNVNLQMNYWPTYSTNMAECAEPLIDYVDSLREPGRVTAKIYAGIESTEENPANGFMAHTQNNPFGWTCPGWSFDWGWSPAAVPWILQNCWEHYEYTGDLEYMKKNIYPMLKEEAVLYSQMLIEDPDGGGLVCSPAYSPEHGPRTNGNTYEQTLIWQLFEDTITAGELLGEEKAVLKEWQDIQDNLKGPIEVGASGQIKEWYVEEEFNKDANGNKLGEGFGHRHMSHLLGLFPGDLISVDTPELLQAAVVSLENRVDKSTGWGMGQRINSWARTGNGDHAYKLITDLFNGGILTNLWDTHSPYQIDGNFGMTSGVAEMLLQSNMGYINVLPALPSAWADGEVEGLVARGNFEIGMKWKEGSPCEVTVLSQNGGEAQVQTDGIATATIEDQNGNPVSFEVISDNRISFDTVKGKSYVITNIPARNTLAAPESLKATRLDDTSVSLTWDAVDAAGAAYAVYRQADDGDVQLIAENITETSYIDETASDLLGTLKYQVQAVVTQDGSKTGGKLSAQVSVQDLRSMAGMIDDRDERITYSSGWSKYGEPGLYESTSTFIEQPVGNETAKMTFKGTGIEVYATVNADRGIAEIWIDGVNAGDADSYSSSKANYTKIFEKTGLTNGVHTLELKVANRKNQSSSKAKFEFDAFKVLDESTSVNSVTVTSKSGIHTLAKADSTLQMQAAVDTQNKNKKVTWSVTDTNGNATSLAQIDQNGLLTVGDTSGTVRVKATSMLSTSAAGTMDITIAIAGGNVPQVDEIVEFTVNSEGGGLVQNPDFEFTGGKWGTWAETGCYNNSKIDAFETGCTVTASFEGTGIELYGPSNQNYGDVEIYIDDELIETVSQHGGDVKIVKHFAKMDLTEGAHTLKCIVKAEGKGGSVAIAGFDYLKIFRPDPSSGAIADKSELQELIQENANNYEEKYTESSWSAYKIQYDAAVAVMNDSEATEAEISAAVNGLRGTSLNLQEKDQLPKPDVAGKAVSVINKETTSITLAWDPVDTAVSYTVYVNGEAAGRTSDCAYRVSGLSAGTEYAFVVEAVNRIQEKDRFPELKAATNAPKDQEAPSKVENLKRDGLKFTWNASTDNSESVSYEVWVNGKMAAAIAETSYTLEELTQNENYTVSVYALDAANNRSIPAAISFKYQGAGTVLNIESVEACAPITAAYGTAFGNLNLPANVSVTLSNKRTVQTSVIWDSNTYTATKSGRQTVIGELGIVEEAQNSKNLKASIEVNVEEKPGNNVTVQAPEKLSRLGQKAQGTSWITLSWNQSVNADGYLVYRSDGKKKDVLIADIAKGSTVSYKVRKVNGNKGGKLKAGTVYTFKVVPYAKDGSRKLTGIGKTLKAATATKAPVVRLERASSKVALIKWKKIKSATGYQVAMSNKKTKGYKTLKPIKKNKIVKFKKSGLKKGRTYYFKVRTYKTVGGKKVYSAYSKPGRVKM